MNGFGPLWVNPKTFSERRAIAKNLNPALLAKATVLLDGRHSAVVYNNKEAEKGGHVRRNYWSYKLKCSAFNTQAAIIKPSWFVALSDSLPAASNNDQVQAIHNGFDVKVLQSPPSFI